MVELQNMHDCPHKLMMLTCQDISVAVPFPISRTSSHSKLLSQLERCSYGLK